MGISEYVILATTPGFAAAFSEEADRLHGLVGDRLEVLVALVARQPCGQNDEGTSLVVDDVGVAAFAGFGLALPAGDGLDEDRRPAANDGVRVTDRVEEHRVGELLHVRVDGFLRLRGEERGGRELGSWDDLEQPRVEVLTCLRCAQMGRVPPARIADRVAAAAVRTQAPARPDHLTWALDGSGARHGRGTRLNDRRHFAVRDRRRAVLGEHVDRRGAGCDAEDEKDEACERGFPERRPHPQLACGIAIATRSGLCNSCTCQHVWRRTPRIQLSVASKSPLRTASTRLSNPARTTFGPVYVARPSKSTPLAPWKTMPT